MILEGLYRPAASLLARRSRLVILALSLQVAALLIFGGMKRAFIYPPTTQSAVPDLSSLQYNQRKPVLEQPVGPNISTSTPTKVSQSVCVSYDGYSRAIHEPRSTGQYQLPYQRPDPACRTFNSSEVETAIDTFRDIIKDPDLFRLFENTFPNTLDTTIRWRGVARNDVSEELAFVVTGDIGAMWVRDSAQQLHAYASLISPSSDNSSLASLFRGNINFQARSIAYQPWCNSYTAPEESGIERGYHGAPYQVSPPLDWSFCHTPNFELDSFAAFFMASYDYYSATKDAAFFARHGWIEAVRRILEISRLQMEPFFNASDGEPLNPAYTFMSNTQVFSATLGIRGLGNPVNYTGMVKAPFRPSDDAAIFQFLVPANMMLSSYLGKGAEIMEAINTSQTKELTQEMQDMAKTIRDAIEKHGVVPHPDGSGRPIYAFEVDGFGGRNLMDDANLPSLLSAPLLDYVKPDQPEWQTYLNTRAFVNSPANPWYSRGPVITGIGSPHTSTGNAWPMALITTILTSDDDAEIVHNLRQLLASTDGLGLMHESVDSRSAATWTRHWFAWANSLFGQMILDLRTRKPHILAMSFQDNS